MNCIADDPKPDCLFAYTGRPFDKEVGLQSNELRHYDPTVGRWLNDEPFGCQPDGDLYRYPVNRPEWPADSQGIREGRARPRGVGRLAGSFRLLVFVSAVCAESSPTTTLTTES